MSNINPNKAEPVIVKAVRLSVLDTYTVEIANPKRLKIRHVEINCLSNTLHPLGVRRFCKEYGSVLGRISVDSKYDSSCSFDAFNSREDLCIIICASSSLDFTATIKLYT